MQPIQQHFLKKYPPILKDRISQIIEQVNPSRIIEFGGGEGDFTLLLPPNRKIISIEIDGTLKDKFYHKIKQNGLDAKFVNEDLREFVFSDGDMCVSAPPYDLLPDIFQKIGDKIPFILMVPENRVASFPHQEVLYTFEGNDFYPESRGKHCVISHIYD